MKKAAFRTCLYTLFTIVGCLQISADNSADEREPHHLKPLEILGIKNQPDAESGEAVTRITAVETRRLGINTVKDVATIAPNFHIPDYGSRMTSSIYVRGLGSRMDQAVVGLSIDNIPFLNKDNYDFDVADIERIEIIRGAQSVLNGRNTMGGQINIRTLSPMLWQGYRAKAGYGSGNTFDASLGWYGKLDDKLGMSLTVSGKHSDGFFRNLYDNRRLDHEGSVNARWKTQWQPSSRLSMTNVATYSAYRQGGYPYANVETGEIAYNDPCSYKRNSFADGLTVAWAGKRVVVTSLTSVQYLDDRMQLDQDFTPADYFTLTQDRQELAITEDLFTRGSRGQYSWLGGVFAFWRDTDMKAPVTFKDTGIAELIEAHRNDMNPYYPISWDSRQFVLGSSFKMQSWGVALYHESVYHLDKWRFEVGIRCDIEQNSLKYRSHCDTGFSTKHLDPETGIETPYTSTKIKIDDSERLPAKTYVELLPKVTVSYDFGSISPYFTFSKGYKAGGFNTQMFSDVLQQRIMGFMGISEAYTLEEIVNYEPEKSLNYELGVHSKWLDKKLSADLALFYINCTNQQMTIFPPGMMTGRIMTNAGRTRSFGAELSVEYRPTDDISIKGSYGYTNATFRSYNDGREDFRGKKVPYVPSNTIFASLDWRIPELTFWDITPSLSISARGVGNIYWNEANTIRQKFYCLPSASVNFSKGMFALSLWGKNLSNTRYNTFYFKSIGNSFVQQGRPLELGFTLRFTLSK